MFKDTIPSTLMPSDDNPVVVEERKSNSLKALSVLALIAVFVTALFRAFSK
jgi:hypothetical protein